MAIAIVNPTTGETVEEFVAHSAAEIEIRLQKAQAAHENIRDLTYAQRGLWM